MANAANPYAPDLTAKEIFTEKAWLQGALLASITYGWVVVLSILCVYMLVQTGRSYPKRLTYGLLTYVIVIFISSTIFQACNSVYTQLAFIENREYPGGPGAYEDDFWNIPVNAAGNTLFVFMNWMADGLLVWRFMIIFSGCRVPKVAYMFIPGISFLGSLTLGILYIRQQFITNVFESGNDINWSDKFLGLSLSLNIALTLAISTRLTFFRFKLRKVLGPAHGTQYTTVAAMIVESAVLYSVASLLFLVPFALGHQLSIVIIQALSSIQMTSSLLIIYRVAQGKAWSSNTGHSVMTRSSAGLHGSGVEMKTSTIRFAHNDSQTLRGSETKASDLRSGEEILTITKPTEEMV